MKEIKRCPFCGLVEAIEEKTLPLENGGVFYTQFCRGYTAEKGICISFCGASTDEVISLWNNGMGDHRTVD